MQRPGPTSCRIVETGESHEGGWNMALDEVLLEQAVSRNVAAVRVYAWLRPTITLGYFQDPAELSDDPLLDGLDLVRRLSGGGAIVHHHEWTYSCVVPGTSPLAAEPNCLYQTVHQALIRLLEELGVSVGLRGPGNPADSPTLCFARSAAEDLLTRSQKVLGSAQRRRRGAVLQHGSLLLRSSPHAPQFPGLLNLAPRLQLPEDLPIRIARTVGESLADSIEARPVTAGEREEAGELARSRYAEVKPRRSVRL